MKLTAPKYGLVLGTKLRMKYDALGNRVVKEVPKRKQKEIYVRDAQGNILALYEVKNDSLYTKEFYMYGSQRLGYIEDEMFLGRMCIGKWCNVLTPVLPMFPSTLSNSVSIVFGKKRYELSDWLGNVRVVINDRKTPVNIGTTTVGYKAQVVNVSDYYSYGSTINERTYDYSSTKFRFAFNGKELDNEVYGRGNTINYDARTLDTRIGRFLSVDPLISNYPMLTPYQISSNNPIFNVDLDGLEGVSYRIVKRDEITGNIIPIKRVIEVNVHIAVNENGKNGAYSILSADKLKNTITTKFNENKYLDESGLPTEFRFNFVDFDPQKIKPTDLAKSLKNNRIPTNYSVKSFDSEGNSVVKPYESFKDVVMWKSKIDASGLFQAPNKIQINPDRGIYDFGHAECHELTHFLLMSNGFTFQTPNTIDEHSLGGWMQYGKRYIEDGKMTRIEGVNFNLSQDAFNNILKSVPRIDDKTEK